MVIKYHTSKWLLLVMRCNRSAYTFVDMFAYKGKYRAGGGARLEYFYQPLHALEFARENIRQCLDFLIVGSGHEKVYDLRMACEDEELNILILKQAQEE